MLPNLLLFLCFYRLLPDAAVPDSYRWLVLFRAGLLLLRGARKPLPSEDYCFCRSFFVGFDLAV